MRVLVTGGSGFVGAAVVRALLAQGTEVTCLVRETSPVEHLRQPGVRLVEGDLTDADAAARAMTGCSDVYHVAAAYSTRPENAAQLYRVNVDGTAHVLEAARAAGVRRLVHTSTIGTIGRPADGSPATERDGLVDLEQASAYVRSKLEGERLALEAAGGGLPVVVVNPCAPVGVGDVKPSSTGQRIVDYLQGRTPSFLPGGINFCPVDDIAQGHLLAAERGRVGQRYILGHTQGNMRLDDFFRIMARASGQLPPVRESDRQSSAASRAARRLLRAARRLLSGASATAAPAGYQPAALTADPSLAIRELGLPQTSLEAAFSQAVTWFREHGYA